MDSIVGGLKLTVSTKSFTSQLFACLQECKCKSFEEAKDGTVKTTVYYTSLGELRKSRYPFFYFF